MNAAAVRLDKIGKRYGAQWVVHDVNLSIRAGEFFTFLGPSGCGKTTLLRMIAGFIAPDEGLLYLDDQVVNQVPPWRRNIGMVFQNYALWPHMTVFENVAFGLRERKLSRHEIDSRVGKALEQVDLKGTESRRPSQLSGGQQQRVALARTLVIQPRVLLLDEPLSNLDAKLRVEMRLELLKLQRHVGLTTIYVTHDQEEALAMSTRIAVIDHGQMVQEGQPREIYEQPANEFVAGFVGQANLLSGRIRKVEGDRITVDFVGGQSIELTATSFGSAEAGDELCVSIRPETVELSDVGVHPDGSNRMEGKIVASAYQGAFIEYEIAALGKAIKARVTNPKGKRVFCRGDEVAFTFAAEDVIPVPAKPRQ
ncbi:MAG TPA: ABC transporter ATP-binding protein [Candidatus Binatia bacterium]